MCNRGVILIAATLLAAATPLRGQTAAELREQVNAMQARRTTSYERMLEAEDAARTTPDDSMKLHGATVRFLATHLSARDRATVERAFDAAARELTSTFGPDGASLLAGDEWMLWFVQRRAGSEIAALGLIGRAQRLSVNLVVPLRQSDVQHLVVTRAATSIATKSAGYAAWIGHNFTIDDAERTHYFAYRQLVFHASEESRRCARGVVSDCARTHGVAVAQSMLRYAIELDGRVMQRFLQNAPIALGRPTAEIAAALGQNEEEFLKGWHSRIAASGATRAKGTSSMLFTSLGWCALFAVAASRRRPK